MSEAITFTNISFYFFVDLGPKETLGPLRRTLREKCQELGFKGTVILAPEGINGFLAGTASAIAQFKAWLNALSPFERVAFKDSYSSEQPFRRLKIKLKNEIISVGAPEAHPARLTGKRLDPEELARWLDEKRDLVLVDTRNDYELAAGTFENAIDLNLKVFRQFGEALETLPAEIRERPVVMFCTGGIRCEKATSLALLKGFKDVYQLEGGILKYFEKCGGRHYRGDCFVFDERYALDPALAATVEVSSE